MRRFNSQTLILIGATVFVLYLAGVPLLCSSTVASGARRSGSPERPYLQNYVKAYFDKEFYFFFELHILWRGDLHRHFFDRNVSRLG